MILSLISHGGNNDRNQFNFACNLACEIFIKFIGEVIGGFVSLELKHTELIILIFTEGLVVIVKFILIPLLIALENALFESIFNLIADFQDGRLNQSE